MCHSSHFLLILCILLLDLTDHGHGADDNLVNWCYTDPKCSPEGPDSDWNLGPDKGVYCNSGTKQTPIDLSEDYKNMAPEPNSVINFDMKSYDFLEFLLKNGGNHLALTEFKTATDKPSTFTWNDDTYTLIQIHLHWGPNDNTGSEHTIGGKSFTMEMHLVHLKTAGADGGHKDFDAARASKKEDALAVIGIFFQADKAAGRNPVNAFTPHLRKIGKKGCSKKVKGTGLSLPTTLKATTKAITYFGSLTTPGCDEIVKWVVIPEPAKVRPSCTRMFRKHLRRADNTSITKNYRAIQPINDRVPPGVVGLTYT